MTIARTEHAAGTPYELDVRRQLNQARRDLAEAHAELAARRDQETALRTHLESLAADVRATGQAYTELHVAYVELLTHARATVAAAAHAEPAPAAYIAGHLEEIGLQPTPGAVPKQVVAEGLSIATQVSRAAS
ncbi:hypothetical protein E1281_11690 [Actinomadura sp. KC345]|uniref:hypothetical protein n=1 Tax=Actinomadura sp. KC345 TaxID=2530371 RepID=UPI00104CAC23|nr:hypothetical protein [Actinomadura sp. KC345]TDC55589.1 hypothetical protein E1281_11690 [Actinomadura sp. KC345]